MTCVALVWRDTPPWSMGGRRHPTSGGVDGLCNKNTWRELRKRRRLAGGKQQHGCYSFLYVPLVNRGLELPSEAHWDVFSPLYQELGQKCCVMCGFLGFLSAPREITVLYPSLADWSESPPYSALPRPGVEPLENKRTALFMRFSCCPYPQTVTWTRGISFNEKYQHWRLWREGGPARMTMLNEITLSSTEDVS